MATKTKADAPRNNAGKMRADGMPVGKPFGPDNPPRGRPKGSRHKLSEDLFKALAEDFENHGKDAIAKMREDRPGDYIRVIASLVPKEATLTINPFDDLTDEQLFERYRILNAEIATYLPDESDGGSVKVGGRNQKKTKH